MTKAQEEKQLRIKKILDDAGKALASEGVEYFVAAVDKNGPDGGQAYVQSDIKGESFVHVLDMALPTKQDAINLGIYVGQILKARQKQK